MEKIGRYNIDNPDEDFGYIEEEANKTECTDARPDFTEFYYSASICANMKIPRYFTVQSIGWLSNVVYNFGVVSPEVIEALTHYRHFHTVDEGDLGYHTCELCDAYDDRGEILVQLGGVNYLLPSMIIHYIEAHDYCPPPKSSWMSF